MFKYYVIVVDLSLGLINLCVKQGGENMSNCEHVIAMIGDEFISKENFQDAVVEWVGKVRYYNENTLRLAIEPPVNLTTCAFCPKCGEELDRSSSEKVISDAIEKHGDGREVYDAIYKAKNGLSK